MEFFCSVCDEPIGEDDLCDHDDIVRLCLECTFSEFARQRQEHEAMADDKAGEGRAHGSTW